MILTFIILQNCMLVSENVTVVNGLACHMLVCVCLCGSNLKCPDKPKNSGHYNLQPGFKLSPKEYNMCKSLLNHELGTCTVYILLTIVPKRAYQLSKFHVKYVKTFSAAIKQYYISPSKSCK